MKKKLEADLISIAHRILKIKNKSDINQLYLETQKLYEKLAVLKFIDENFDAQKPTIGRTEIETEIETIFEKEEIAPAESITITETPIKAEEIAVDEVEEPKIIEPIKEVFLADEPQKVETATETIIPELVPETISEPIVENIQETTNEVIDEPLLEKEVEPLTDTNKETNTVEEFSFRTFSDLKPIPDFKPSFELEREEIKEEIKTTEIPEDTKVESTTKSNLGQILFEDFGINYGEAQFVKVDDFENVSPTSVSEFKEKKTSTKTVQFESEEPKSIPLNDKLAKGFHIDLNDRIAFTKHLFGNSSEDYSRVLNQMLTFDTYNEAKDFIESMVKPDYNNWEGKDDYAERFLEIIEKKFA